MLTRWDSFGVRPGLGFSDRPFSVTSCQQRGGEAPDVCLGMLGVAEM